MKNKMGLWIVIGIIAVIVLGVLGYSTTAKMRQESTLREEARMLSSIENVTDPIDMTIKTTGDYAIVEETMKTYMKEYMAEAAALEELYNTEDLNSIFDFNSYKNDIPEFTDTKEKISKYQDETKRGVEKIVSMTSKDAIMDRIKEKKLNQSYVKLYENLMLDDEVIKDLQEIQTQLTKQGDLIDRIFSSFKEMFQYLSDNQSKWVIQGSNFVFSDRTALNEYNNLVYKTRDLCQELANSEE